MNKLIINLLSIFCKFIPIYYEIISNIKETTEEIIVGIDEAGRGPVIGPMVYAAYVMHTNERRIRQFIDSKQLTPNTRKNYYATMMNFAYIVIEPIYITTHMNNHIKKFKSNCRRGSSTASK